MTARTNAASYVQGWRDCDRVARGAVRAGPGPPAQAGVAVRGGAVGTLFDGIRAPSTLGSFLRSFTWGNVRQLEAAGRVLLSRLAATAPLLPGKDVLAFTGIDSMQKRVYGHAKAGAAFGHTKIQGKSLLVRGLNVLAAVVSTRFPRR